MAPKRRHRLLLSAGALALLAPAVLLLALYITRPDPGGHAGELPAHPDGDD